MRLLKMLTVMWFVAVLGGCGKPLPADKAAYAGHWSNQHMDLLITPAGSVKYQRRMGNVHESIDAPIQEFTDEGFTAGIGPLKGKFKVTVPPHEVDGKWKMTVDGLELTRQ